MQAQSTMTLSQIARSAFEFWKAGINDRPFTVLGSPGIGKTSIGHEIARRMYEYHRRTDPDAPPPITKVIDLSNKNPEDTAGLPNFHIVDEQSGEGWTSFLPLRWLYELSQDDIYGVLVLDDITQASRAVQAATRQLILQGEIDGTKLNDNVLVLVTGNRQSDGAFASQLPSHFRNSVSITTMSTSVDEWCRWYGRQGLPGVVSAFMQFKGHDLLTQLPEHADENGAFATPRQWEAVGRRLPILERMSQQEPNIMLIRNIESLVGRGPAAEFDAYRKLRGKLPDPRQMVDDPHGSLPNPEVLFSGDETLRHAAVTSIMEETARRDHTAQPTPGKGIQAMCHVLGHRMDLGAVGLITYQNAGGDTSRLKRAMQHILNDRNNMYRQPVHKLLEHFQSAVSGA